MTSMEKKEMPPAQPYGAERGETGLAPEGETIDATEFFEDYRQHKLEEVGVEAEAALDIPDPDALARNAGYGEEESERLVLEAGIREELEKNRQAIESLEVEAKEGIMAVDTAPETFSRELPQAEAGAGAETSEPDAEKERTMEKFREERAGILERTLTSEVVSSGLDFVPIAGGVKMTVEGIAGKTLWGKKLEGRYRIIHTEAGIATIALDFTGIGEVEKGAIIVGKGFRHPRNWL